MSEPETTSKPRGKSSDEPEASPYEQSLEQGYVGDPPEAEQKDDE